MLEVSSKGLPGLLFKKNGNTWVLPASSYTARTYKAKPFQEVQHMVKADVGTARENKYRYFLGTHVTNIQVVRPSVVTSELRICEIPSSLPDARACACVCVYVCVLGVGRIYVCIHIYSNEAI